MKKITLFITAFIFAVGAYAQEDNCSKEVLEGGGNAWGQLHKYIFASDFRVEENESFILTSLKFNAITTPGVPVDGVTIYFYEDTGSGPGVELGIQEISEISMTPLGEYAGLDHSTMALELNNPMEFQGIEDATTTYWVGIMLDFSENDISYLEVTEEFDTDNATYFYDFQTQTWTDGASPYWPIGGFEHAMVSLYGDCSVLDVEDFGRASFTHFTKNDQLFLESRGNIQEVAIFNLLGQQMISETVNATSGSINLSTLSAGVYLTKLNVEGKTKIFRISVK